MSTTNNKQAPSTPLNDGTKPAATVTGSISLRRKKKARTGEAPKIGYVQPNSIQYILCENTDLGDKAPAVLLLLNEDYLEYAMTYPFYNRDFDEAFPKYIENLGAYNNIIHPLDPTTGTVMKRPNPNFDPEKVTYYGKGKNRRVQPEYWNAKAIVIPIESGTSDKDVLAWHNQVFVPNMDALRGHVLKEGSVINLHPVPIVRKKYFSDMFAQSDLLKIANTEFSDDYANLKEFFTADKAHIYGFWKPGELPLRIMRNYRLLEKHVENVDWERFKTSTKEEDKVQTDLKSYFDKEQGSKDSA